jgi:LPXTG-motif cell wall-anchored protein
MIKAKTTKILKNTVFVLAVFSAVVLAQAIATPPSAHAAPNQLEGTVYWDQNNNGVQDGGEPGLEGLVVRFGGNSAPSTVTDANGDYTLTGVSGTATLEVFTGWLRSQCDSISCAAGPGADNDFAVNNQFIQRASTSGTIGGAFDVGLIPDWGGTYPVTTVNVPRPTDIAARITYLNGCDAGTGAERLCAPVDSLALRSMFMNQGTEPISNPVFTLQMPVGHTLTDVWTTNNQTNPSSNSVTVLQSFDPALGYGVYRLNGTLEPGASSAVFTTATVEANAIGSPTPYATADPRDKQAVLQVLSMDQSGDPDSTFCLNSEQGYFYGNCALGILGDHDKTVASDHTDGATWNVSGTFVTRVDSVEIMASPAAPVNVCSNSRTTTVTLTTTNTSTGDSPLRNIEIALNVPSGLNFHLADNPGWFISGDGRPHTFINLAMLPNGNQDLDVVLAVNDTVTVTDNGTSALQLGAEIVAYDTARVTVQPAGNSTFDDGGLAGSLLALEDVSVMGDGCPAAGSPDDQLANTGESIALPIVISGILLVVAGAGLYLGRRYWHKAKSQK